MNDSIYWGYCTCPCGCREGTGPWADADAARLGICGTCDNGSCLSTSHVGPYTRMRREEQQR
jgi:hypothetical protein